MAGYRYDVALSFAGEIRPLAQCVGAALLESCAIFLDEREKTNLWGTDLIETLPAAYRAARLCVILLCNSYLRKFWTTLERDVLLSEVFQEIGPERILCVCVPTFAAELPEHLAPITVRLEAGRECEQTIALVKQRLETL